MPESHRTFQTRLRPAFPASLAISAACLLQACFVGGAYDSPYTVPAGESFDALHLEVEEDGTVLLLAQTAMYFGHEDPQTFWDSVPQRRNYQTILLRRSEGVWSEKPFKNLQRDLSSFPALSPDPAGRFHALVWDYKSAVRYVFRDGKWEPGKALGLPPYFGSYSYDPWRNWSRHPHIALENDSTAHFITTVYGIASEASTHPGGGRTFLDTSYFLPAAFHVEPAFRAAFGSEQPFYREGRTPEFSHRIVYYFWPAGADTAGKRILHEQQTPGEGVFVRNRDHTTLYYSTFQGIEEIRLDPRGAPAAARVHPRPDTSRQGISLFAADSLGCIHRFGYDPSADMTVSRMVHRNDCSGITDTLPIPPAPAGRAHMVHSSKFRIQPSGSPMAAFLVREMSDRSRNFGERYQPTWIYLAEWKGGKWVLELVTRK